MKDILQSDSIFWGMGFLGALCLILQFVVCILLQNLERASGSMGATKNRVIKSMQMKMQTSLSLKLGCHNVDAFVDRTLCHAKWMGIYLSTWEGLCGQIRTVTALGTMMTVLLQVIYQCGQAYILSTLTGGILTVGLCVWFGQITGLKERHRRIRTNLTDYLENVLLAKFENEIEHKAEMEKYRQEYFLSQPESSEQQPDTESSQGLHITDLSPRDQKIFEEILQEYLV